MSRRSTPPALDPEIIRAAVRRLCQLRDELDGVLALLLPAGTDPSPASVPPLDHREEPRWVALKIAAHECGVNTDTMARRAREHGLGRRVGHSWQIDMARVEALREGRSYVKITDLQG